MQDHFNPAKLLITENVVKRGFAHQHALAMGLRVAVIVQVQLNACGVSTQAKNKVMKSTHRRSTPASSKPFYYKRLTAGKTLLLQKAHCWQRAEPCQNSVSRF